MTGRASSQRDADQVGRTAMITLITPMRRFAITRLRMFFVITRWFPKILAIEPMKAVHFTYWSILTDIPYNGAPQLPERPDHPWLIWGTVFNAAVDPYIEGFVAVVDKQIKMTWGRAFGFPGTTSIKNLRQYIESLSWLSSYRYSAYPEATVRTVLSAMDVEREHRFLAELAATADSATFASAYRGFLIRCQGDL
jgi:hypothetical protein